MHDTEIPKERERECSFMELQIIEKLCAKHKDVEGGGWQR